MAVKTMYVTGDGEGFDIYSEAVVYEALIDLEDIYLERHKAISLAKFLVSKYYLIPKNRCVSDDSIAILDELAATPDLKVDVLSSLTHLLQDTQDTTNETN